MLLNQKNKLNQSYQWVNNLVKCSNKLLKIAKKKNAKKLKKNAKKNVIKKFQNYHNQTLNQLKKKTLFSNQSKKTLKEFQMISFKEILMLNNSTQNGIMKP